MNIQWYGCRRDMKDARDHMFDPHPIHLPETLSLKAHCPPVMDQSAIGSCTAHGITAALRYEMIRNGHMDVPLSRLQLYYDERVMENTVKSDAGAEIRDGIKVAAKLGVAHEALWPYKINRLATKPTAEVRRDALQFRALKYQRVEVGVEPVKQALAMRHVVIIGVTLYKSFDSLQVEKTGIIPMPVTRGTHRENIDGGHCLYLWGYGQHRGYFSARNSWNTDWGDHGDCYFPEEYIGSKLLGSDYWVITSEGVK